MIKLNLPDGIDGPALLAEFEAFLARALEAPPEPYEGPRFAVVLDLRRLTDAPCPEEVEDLADLSPPPALGEWRDEAERWTLRVDDAEKARAIVAAAIAGWAIDIVSVEAV